MSKIPVTPSESQYVIHADSAQILSHPNIFLWGLEERLLNIVESYLGVPVAYRGVFFQRDLANGQNVSTRLWHKDPEDYRIVKILVYLNDVNENGGPFEYIPRYLNPQPFRLRYQLFFSDSEMARLVPKSEWVSCTGTAETVIFFDPHNIFHRGKLPTGSDRFAIFFAYHSRKPIKVFRGHWKAPFSHDELLVLSRTLSQRQRECVFWWEHEDQSFKPDLMRDH
ncbi:MAG TPA: phytanoyl-CoA dioxygenase [Cyanobacteria bacterium UBA11370]|nr:phytanoyl-CoA dioxygenase [Cyanobacteria bacterium UBA11370]HBY79688.1 phytanoyl-CoA dioxygenase [Cyanobacteria bacterium UBA11148]